MRTLSVRLFIAAFLLAAAAVAFANPFKSKIISSDDSVLETTVPGDHVMKITNFTQEGGTDRAVVQVSLPGDAPNGGATNVLTATRIDLSTGANAQNVPEINNRVTIAGPAIVRIQPVVGARSSSLIERCVTRAAAEVEVEVEEAAVVVLAQRRFRSLRFRSSVLRQL